MTRLRSSAALDLVLGITGLTALAQSAAEKPVTPPPTRVKQARSVETLPNGKSIAPTGKRFAIGMATIAHWKGKTMDHEWLYWDNQDFMTQLGLGK